LLRAFFKLFLLNNFYFFFKNLNKLQKIKFLKNIYSLLVSLLIVSIFFLLILGCLFFYIKIIEVAQIHHLYEVQQLFHDETQTILLHLLEKQKLYLIDTVKYQNVTSLINFTDIVIKYQELILDILLRYL